MALKDNVDITATCKKCTDVMTLTGDVLAGENGQDGHLLRLFLGSALYRNNGDIHHRCGGEVKLFLQPSWRVRKIETIAPDQVSPKVPGERNI